MRVASIRAVRVLRRASTAPQRPVILRDLKINESDRRRMSIETVRARLHEAAVSRQIPQYVEPTTGGRVWTAPALKAAAAACGCRGGATSQTSAEAPCPFCADDGTTALRHAADARAEVKSSEILAGGGSRLAAMRARLDEQAAPPSLKATSGDFGGGCGGGSVPDDEGDDEEAPPAVWRPP
jgi:hypothetical protein